MATKKRTSTGAILPKPITPQDVEQKLSAVTPGSKSATAEPPSAFLRPEEQMQQTGNTLALLTNKFVPGANDVKIQFTENIGKPENDEDMQVFRDNNKAIIERNKLANAVYDLKLKQTAETNQLIGEMNRYRNGESAFSHTSQQMIRNENPYDSGGLWYNAPLQGLPTPEVPEMEKLQSIPAPIYNKVQVSAERRPVAARGGGGGKAEKPVDLMLPVLRPDGSKGDNKAGESYLTSDFRTSLEANGPTKALQMLSDQSTAMVTNNREVAEQIDRMTNQTIVAGIIKGDLAHTGAKLSLNGKEISPKDAVVKDANGNVSLKPGVGWYLPHETIWTSANGSVIPKQGMEGRPQLDGKKFTDANNQIRDFLQKTLFHPQNPQGQAILQAGFKQTNADGKPIKNYDRTKIEFLSTTQTARAAGLTPSNSKVSPMMQGGK